MDYFWAYDFVGDFINWWLFLCYFFSVMTYLNEGNIQFWNYIKLFNVLSSQLFSYCVKEVFSCLNTS